MASGQTQRETTASGVTSRQSWPGGRCPVTVDLPFCQWILLVRRVLPLKFALFGIILRVMSVAEAAERVEPTRTRSYLPRRLH